MGKFLLLATILGTTLVTLRKPFVGAMAYYCLAIWGPQYIWWWNFEGMRVSFMVAVVSFIALGIAVSTRGLNFFLLKSRINLCVLILWISFVISYNFAPYVSLLGEIPYQTLVDVSKIFMFYFAAVLLVDDLEKQKYFSCIIILSMIHLTFWANNQYLSQNWSAFQMGRLMGPYALTGGSIYRDENAFAMFFVTASPFLFYWGLHMTKGIYRYALWAVIPLGWHAIFLTGSRGGLVGLGATLAASVVFSKNKKIFIFLFIPLFLIAFYFQAGDLLKSRSGTIIEYEGESSAETRIQAWSSAMAMMNAHPITGIGPKCFVTAMADFSDKTPRDTHSTPFQFGSEIGVLALIAYCLINLLVLWQGLRNNGFLKKFNWAFEAKELYTLRYLNESSMVSFFGLSVCSLFLSLNYYEIYYFLLIISGFLNYYIQSKVRIQMAERQQASHA